MSGRTAEVVIIGGGLVGAATAYFLAREGIESVVVERDGIGSHASGFSYAALGTFDEEGMDGAHFDVASHGMRLHHELAKSLLEETGINVEFRERPQLVLAFDEEEAQAARNPEGWEKERLSWEVDRQGYSVGWLGPEEALAIEPRISPAALGAMYTEGTCDVNAQRLTLALAEAAELRGAEIRHGTVTGVTKTGDRVGAVVVDGTEIACERVVVAMGPWSEAASHWLGVPIRMQPWKGQILRLRLPGPPIRASVAGGDHFASTKPDGLTWVGPTFEDAGLDESTTTEGPRPDHVLRGQEHPVAGGRPARHSYCLHTPAFGRQEAGIGRGAGPGGCICCDGRRPTRVDAGPRDGVAYCRADRPRDDRSLPRRVRPGQVFLSLPMVDISAMIGEEAG